MINTMNINNILKHARVLGVAALMLTGQSCSDVLNETVVSGIGNDYMNTTKGYEDAVNAAYSSLRNYYATQAGLTMTEYGTDIYATGAGWFVQRFSFL
jgi:hypothetical protein